MITAHLPSGIVLGKLLPQKSWVFPAAVLGAVLPDFDLFWFYFIDDSAFHHHKYWVHAPAFWAAIAIVVLPLVSRFARELLPTAVAFFAGLFLHICLDSVAGDIMWAWPLSDQLYHLVTVTARYEHWILNFVLHPVFLLEIAIWIWAIFLVVRTSQCPPASTCLKKSSSL